MNEEEKAYVPSLTLEPNAQAVAEAAEEKKEEVQEEIPICQRHMGRTAGNNVVLLSLFIYIAPAFDGNDCITHNIDIPFQCNVTLIKNRNIQIPRSFNCIRHVQIAVAARQLRIPSGV